MDERLKRRTRTENVRQNRRSQQTKKRKDGISFLMPLMHVAWAPIDEHNAMSNHADAALSLSRQ